MTGQRRSSYIPPTEEISKPRRKKFVGITLGLSLIVAGAAATPALVASAAVDAPFSSGSQSAAAHHRHHRHHHLRVARAAAGPTATATASGAPTATVHAAATTSASAATSTASPTATASPSATASASSSTSSTTSSSTTASASVASLPDQGTVHTVSGTDASAVQSAISAAGSGDTVKFPAGTYSVGRLAVKAGVLYKGASGAVLKGSGTIISCSSCSNTSFDGLTFDGGNVVLGADGATSTKVQFVNNTVKNVKNSGFGTGQAVLANNLSDSVIGGNTFTDDGTEAAQNSIVGYSLASTQIIDNTMTNVYQGMHIEPRSTSGLTISGNTLSGLTRMGIEVMGNSAALKVTDNTVSSWAGNGGNRIALSIVTHGSGTVVSGNTLDGSAIAQEPGIEFMGTSSTVKDNTITGFGTSVSIACSTGTVFSGNTLSKVGKYGAFSKDGGYCGGETIGVNTVDGKSVTSRIG